MSRASVPSFEGPSSRLLMFGAILWVAAILAGFAAVVVYEGRPSVGVIENASTHPALGQLGRSKLILALHPECPCSAATVSELEKLLAHASIAFDAEAVFVVPPGAPPDFGKDSSLAKRVSRIPGISIQWDTDGLRLRELGATTSGETFFFGPDGRELFHGGLTASRGHEGDSYGTASVAALLAGATPERSTNPVFGCALFSGQQTWRETK